jgi:hypothetical protein
MQVLVIARVVEGTPMEKVLPLVKAEAETVWEKYSAEIVRSVHYIADMSGAILMLEVPSLEQAQEIAAQFPMVKAEVLRCELLPLKPYIGFGELFAKP